MVNIKEDGCDAISLLSTGGAKGNQEWWRATVQQDESAPAHDLAAWKVFLVPETEAVTLRSQIKYLARQNTLGTLARGTAHRFNNLLAAISGQVEFLNMLAGENEKLKERVKKILKVSFRCRDFVDQLRFFNQRYEQRRLPLDLIPLMREIAPLVGELTPKNVFPEWLLPERCPMICACPGDIKQALLNLCANTFPATRQEHGPLRIQVFHTLADGADLLPPIPAVSREVSPDSAIAQYVKPGEYVVLEIGDEGTGMSPEVMKRMFEPFFTTRPLTEAAGLGLSIVAGIMRKHYGRIGCVSEPGKGTRIQLQFPAMREPEKGADLFLEGVESIALATPSPERLEGLKQGLEQLGYQASLFASPEDVLERIEVEGLPFDAILCELQSPPDTTWQFAESVAINAPGVPFVLMADAGAADLDKVQDHGIRFILTNPVTSTEAASILRRLFDGM